MATFKKITCTDLTTNGTLTYINSTNMQVTDSLVKYANGNTGNSIDVGWYAEQDTSTTATYSGVFRDASDSNKFKIFRALQTAPTTTVDTGGTGYTPATLVLGALDLRNPANTFSYLITSAAIAADRTLNLPLLTATDTFAVLDFAQTFTNKTATGATNALTARALRSSAAEIDVFAATAPTAGQVLTATSGTAATWQAAAVPSIQVQAKSADYTLLVADAGIIRMTTGASNRTLTLPTAATGSGYRYIATKVDAGAGSLIVATVGGEFIDDGTATTITLPNQFDHISIVSDGVRWLIV